MPSEFQAFPPQMQLPASPTFQAPAPPAARTVIVTHHTDRVEVSLVVGDIEFFAKLPTPATRAAIQEAVQAVVDASNRPRKPKPEPKLRTAEPGPPRANKPCPCGVVCPCEPGKSAPGCNCPTGK